MSTAQPIPSTISAPALLQRHGDAVMQFVDEFLAARKNVPDRLMESIRYSLLAGGKRLRPGLTMETFETCSNVDCRSRAATNSALACAGAMELIHTFSLVHDDLPAMDNDDLRRGRPTNHKVFGEAMAILAGDAMVTLAFELIAECAEPRLTARLVTELARPAGPGGMIGGQVLDIDSENQSLNLEQLKKLHRLKTGALIIASCRLGAVCADADADHLNAVTRYAEHLGLAFQIVDDLLDVTSTPAELGKATQKDQSKGKNTYPSLLGLDPARTQARREVTAALDAIAPLGPSADGLTALAQFVVDRNL
ncbi:MAG TPA: farnesyl diphosphate synthase [Tepidisphaeraceae bacterium]|nr:farnesyl diphosphate synthase [Tepidisphaeraceae bacterium]